MRSRRAISAIPEKIVYVSNGSDLDACVDALSLAVIALADDIALLNALVLKASNGWESTQERDEAHAQVANQLRELVAALRATFANPSYLNDNADPVRDELRPYRVAHTAPHREVGCSAGEDST